MGKTNLHQAMRVSMVVYRACLSRSPDEQEQIKDPWDFAYQVAGIQLFWVGVREL